MTYRFRRRIGVMVILAGGVMTVATIAAPLRWQTGAEVRLLRKLAIASVRNLSFGRITVAIGGRDLAVTVTPGNTVTTTGGIAIPVGAQRGVFSVQGESRHAYVVQLPASVPLPIGNGSVVAGDFRVRSTTIGTDGSSGYVAAFDSAGLDTLYLGGTLRIPAAQVAIVVAAGSLSIPVQVTVHYQ